MKSIPKRETNIMGIIKKQYIVDNKGKKTAIILPMKQYKQLLEDLHDLAIVAERRNEPVISLEEMKGIVKESGKRYSTSW
jgi:hypothetical protein